MIKNITLFSSNYKYTFFSSSNYTYLFFSSSFNHPHASTSQNDKLSHRAQYEPIFQTQTQPLQWFILKILYWLLSTCWVCHLLGRGNRLDCCGMFWIGHSVGWIWNNYIKNGWYLSRRNLKLMRMPARMRAEAKLMKLKTKCFLEIFGKRSKMNSAEQRQALIIE